MSAPVDPPVPAAEPEATPVQPGPWAADLTEYFGDNPEAIAAADRYMREKVQPRITHLETDSAPARELWKDLNDNADETLATVVEELYGEDVAEKFRGLFGEDGENAPAEVVAEIADNDEVPAWAKPLLERDQAQRDQEAREAGEAEYQQTLVELREAHPDLEQEDIDIIHPFMAAAGGDPEVAYNGYQTFVAQFKKRHGVTPAEAAEETPAAPRVLGDEAAASATPPVEKKYTSIDEAMDDWFAEKRAVAPPVVGSA